MLTVMDKHLLFDIVITYWNADSKEHASPLSYRKKKILSPQRIKAFAKWSEKITSIL